MKKLDNFFWKSLKSYAFVVAIPYATFFDFLNLWLIEHQKARVKFFSALDSCRESGKICCRFVFL